MINAAICYLANARRGGFVESYVARLIDASRNPKDVEKRRNDNWTPEHLEISLFDFSLGGVGWGDPSATIKPDRSLFEKRWRPRNEIANLNAEQFPRLLYIKKLRIIRNRPAVLFSLGDQLSRLKKISIFPRIRFSHLGIESRARSHGHRTFDWLDSG